MSVQEFYDTLQERCVEVLYKSQKHELSGVILASPSFFAEMNHYFNSFKEVDPKIHILSNQFGRFEVVENKNQEWDFKISFYLP